MRERLGMSKNGCVRKRKGDRMMNEEEEETSKNDKQREWSE